MNELGLSKCKFAADIVPYMYGELSASDSSAFESHLLDCGDCTDEFALVSNARYEVYEWKKLDFDPLATPRFVIPYDEVVATASWFDKVRAVLTSSWAIPTVGFASLAVISIFAVTILLSDDRATDVAANTQGGTNVKAETIPPAPPPVEVVKADDDGDSKKATETEHRQTVVRQPEHRRVVTRDSRPARTIEAKTTTADKNVQKAPTLNEFADDEDNSLRLAELFEDIETRE